MHLFKNFFKMISKYKSGLIIYGMIFIVMIVILFANGIQYGAINTDDDKTEIKGESYTIGYVNNSESELSYALIDYLAKDNDMVWFNFKSEDNIKTMVFFAEVNCAITIDEDFEAKVQNGSEDAITYLTAASDGPSIYIIEGLINNYIKTYQTYVDMGFEASEAIEKTNANLELASKAEVYVPEGADTSKADHGADFIVNTAAKFFVYISFSSITLCVGSVLIKSNTGKVAERIKTAPVGPGERTIVNTLGLVICGIVLWVIICVVLFTLGSSASVVREYPVELVLILLVSVICNCAMASFIAAFNLNENALPMVVNILGLGLSFISGVFVPQYVMDPTVLSISKFMPFYWAVRVLDSITPGSGSELEFTPEVLFLSIGIILLSAVVFTIAGALVRRNKAA